MGEWVYRAEVKGIQSWILASDRLRELKGGSALVEDLSACAETVGRGLGGLVRVAAAGSATIEFPNDSSLGAFAEGWPFIVEQVAPGLPVVQAWAPKGQMKLLYEKLGHARNLARMDLPEAGPLLARCGRSGLPAVCVGDKDGMEDRAMQAKTLRAQGGDALAERLLPQGETRTFIEDVDQFPEGYVAVVHADGNRVGERVMGLGDDLDALQRFSRHLGDATARAARRAVARLCEESRAQARIPARPIVLGGDDLTFLVSARYALPFTDLYLQAFADETRDLSGGGLQASAGIALVKPGWPFHSAHELAESLCNTAKNILNRESGFLFHRVTTALADLDWADLVRRELAVPADVARAPEAPASWHLLGGMAYKASEVQPLANLALAARRLPRGSLRAWVAEARVSPDRAAARFQRLREVANKDDLSLFENALRDLGAEPHSGWRGLRSPIPDALVWNTIQPHTLALWR